jgi:putative NIF3 family GTP cyclohydrolase 1 type 2
MNANELYQKLEIDFELDKCSDDWGRIDLGEYVTENFKHRYMGLVLDNAEKIEKVYTAVFPSDLVLKYILDKGEKNVLILTHHPMIWDTQNPGYPFVNINKGLLPKLAESKISLYTLHVPLDKNGEYSTSVNYARAVGISQEEDFAKYYGVWAGIIGKADCNTLNELAQRVREAVGHEVEVIRNNANNAISGQNIAVVGGGGNDLDIMKELLEKGIKTYVTGVASAFSDYPPAVEFDRLAKEHGINLIGASHYSTEKFACMRMTKYFESLGLPAEFVADKPDMGDIT